MPRAESPVSRVAHPVARVLVGLVLTPHLAGRTRADLSLPRASRTPSRLGQSALLHAVVHIHMSQPAAIRHSSATQFTASECQPQVLSATPARSAAFAPCVIVVSQALPSMSQPHCSSSPPRSISDRCELSSNESGLQRGGPTGKDRDQPSSSGSATGVPDSQAASMLMRVPSLAPIRTQPIAFGSPIKVHHAPTTSLKSSASLSDWLDTQTGLVPQRPRSLRNRRATCAAHW